MHKISLLAAKFSSEVFMWFAKKWLVSEVIPFNPQGRMAAKLTLPLSYLLDDFGKSPYTEAIFKLKKTVWKPVFTLCMVRVQIPSVLLTNNWCFFFFFLPAFKIKDGEKQRSLFGSNKESIAFTIISLTVAAKPVGPHIPMIPHARYFSRADEGLMQRTYSESNTEQKLCFEAAWSSELLLRTHEFWRRPGNYTGNSGGLLHIHVPHPICFYTVCV